MKWIAIPENKITVVFCNISLVYIVSKNGFIIRRY